MIKIYQLVNGHAKWNIYGWSGDGKLGKLLVTSGVWSEIFNFGFTAIENQAFHWDVSMTCPWHVCLRKWVMGHHPCEMLSALAQSPLERINYSMSAVGCSDMRWIMQRCFELTWNKSLGPCGHYIHFVSFNSVYIYTRICYNNYTQDACICVWRWYDMIRAHRS